MNCKKLQRKHSCIILACIYNPPGADSDTLRDYRVTSPDTVLQRSPYSVVILSAIVIRLRTCFTHSCARIMDTSSLLRLPLSLERIRFKMLPVYGYPTMPD